MDCLLKKTNTLLVITCGLAQLIFSSCSFSGRITAINQSALSNPYQLSVSDKVVPEYGIASLTVSLNTASNKNISFTYYTQDQTATSGTDYNGISGTATISAGQSQVIVSVPVISNLSKAANKNFYFNISNATNADIAASSSVIQIQDNDYSTMTGISKISTGSDHTCLTTTTGSARCWGSNSFGQLGTGTTDYPTVPTQVPGLSSGIANVVVSRQSFSCALTTGGGVKCWGRNFYGQLGNGTTTDSTTPVDVTGLSSGVTAIGVGTYHSCALTTGGGVKCWGRNADGQLGNGSTTSSSTPVDVTGLTSGVSTLSVGGDHNCIVTTGGGARCWGDNFYGMIGDGTSVNDRTTSVNVTGLTSGVATISAGAYQTCAITTAGALRCWGRNSDGEVGDGSTTQRNTQVAVTGMGSGVASVSTGAFLTCAVMTSGGAKCWGRNTSGEVGDGTFTARTTATDVSGFTSGVLSISAGNSQACLITTSNTAKCWGSNNYGELSYGTSTTNIKIATDPGFLLSTLSSIAPGNTHSCILISSGGVKCWGRNNVGQLGNGTTTDSTTPVDVTGLTSGVTAIASKIDHTCAITTSGGVKCWGGNSYGQLGNGTTTNSTTPVDVTGLTSGVAAISMYGYHTCALTISGGVKCWGYNHIGQLGNGTTTDSTTPVDVTGLSSGATSISCGEYRGCAVLSSGTVKCWGGNYYGELGDGTTTSSTTPITATELPTNTVMISSGEYLTCALNTSGGVKCVGRGDYGQLGDGLGVDNQFPVQVSGLTSGITKIESGLDFTCALSNSGSVKCWGTNSSGQLGNDTFNRSFSPSLALGMESGVKNIFAGRDNVCALTSIGTLKCWGSNFYGQTGQYLNPALPADVVSP